MNKMCPFATETLRTERRITYDEKGRISKVITLNRPQPQMCQGSLCPFYSDGTEEYAEGTCRKIESLLED